MNKVTFKNYPDYICEIIACDIKKGCLVIRKTENDGYYTATPYSMPRIELKRIEDKFLATKLVEYLANLGFSLDEFEIISHKRRLIYSLMNKTNKGQTYNYYLIKCRGDFTRQVNGVEWLPLEAALHEAQTGIFASQAH